MKGCVGIIDMDGFMISTTFYCKKLGLIKVGDAVARSGERRLLASLDMPSLNLWKLWLSKGGGVNRAVDLVRDVRKAYDRWRLHPLFKGRGWGVCPLNGEHLREQNELVFRKGTLLNYRKTLLSLKVGAHEVTNRCNTLLQHIALCLQSSDKSWAHCSDGLQRQIAWFEHFDIRWQVN